MNRNSKKKFLIILISATLIIGAFVLITVTTPSTTGANAEIETDGTGDSDKASASSTLPEKKAAEKLIDETVSQDKVKKNVGEWEQFEMSSKGCERGVYAGKFYYKEFTIFSRTYDKGKTFRIISVN